MRERVSLDGVWKFCPAFTELKANQRFMRPDFDPSNPMAAPGGGEDVGWVEPGFDDSGWLDIVVPSTWNKAFPDLWSYEGYGWYRRMVTIPKRWRGRRVEFTCDASNYSTVLYVNGQRAGVHEGGYVPFTIPIHRLLEFGKGNLIAASVENLPRPDRCPGGQFGWWNYGGMYRSTGLLLTDMVYIAETAVTTDPGNGTASLAIQSTVMQEDTREAQDLQVRALVKDEQRRKVASGSCPVEFQGERAAVSMVLEVADPKLWSLEEPNLYDLSLELREGKDRVRDRIRLHVGIRSVRVEGTRLLLNGRPLLVKGVNRHPEYPRTGHMERELDLRKDLLLVKRLGANAMRCHYPYSPRTYDLCDEMGILCLAEIPLYQWGRPAVQTDCPDALKAAKCQLVEMIRYLRNHPSVFIWSVSNENMTLPKNDTEEYRRLAEMTAGGNIELVDIAHKMDPTRPVVEVSNCWPGDPVFHKTDLCAPNLYIGASSPHVSTLYTLTQRMHERLETLRQDHPGKPILIGEFGSWAIRGLKTDHFPGELYQAALIRNYWEGLMKEPNVVGGFIWAFQDSDVHRRFLWDYEFRVAYGLYDLERRPKEAARTVRSIWAPKK